MTRITETAYAKINLALHVRRRRSDGYHDLESLFAFAQHGDVLHFEAADTLGLRLSGPFADGLSRGPDNLIMRATNALQQTFGISDGASIHLEKHLPVASGIGGGSADAAATLRGLAQLWGIASSEPKLFEIAAALGADVPACLESKTVYGDGRGDVLAPVTLDGFAGMHLLLINPGIGLSTAGVFKAWDGVDLGALNVQRPDTWRNDLAAPAVHIVPEIQGILEQLNAAKGARFVRMSGSGATCFALFEKRADCAAAAVSFQDAWSLISQIR